MVISHGGGKLIQEAKPKDPSQGLDLQDFIENEKEIEKCYDGFQTPPPQYRANSGGNSL